MNNQANQMQPDDYLTVGRLLMDNLKSWDLPLEATAFFLALITASGGDAERKVGPNEFKDLIEAEALKIGARIEVTPIEKPS